MHLLPAGSPLPLFDRFQGPSAERSGVQLTAAEALRLSLHLDLTRLFNVRNRLSIAQFLADGPSSLDYGLPDTLGLSPGSSTDLQRWELVITRAIALYEPRLMQVRVKVMPDTHKPTVARVVISALAALERQLCQFHFDAVLDQPGARPGTPV
jgi:type VI secretion system protein ImpF